MFSGSATGMIFQINLSDDDEPKNKNRLKTRLRLPDHREERKRTYLIFPVIILDQGKRNVQSGWSENVRIESKSEHVINQPLIALIRPPPTLKNDTVHCPLHEFLTVHCVIFRCKPMYSWYVSGPLQELVHGPNQGRYHVLQKNCLWCKVWFSECSKG